MMMSKVGSVFIRMLSGSPISAMVPITQTTLIATIAIGRITPATQRNDA